MGAEQSQEAQLVDSIGKLSSTPKEWPPVIERFLKEIPAGKIIKWKNRKLLEVLLTLIAFQLKEDASRTGPLLEAMRRTLWWEAMYESIPNLNLAPVVAALQVQQADVANAALLLVQNVVQQAGPGDEKAEIEAKEHFFKAKGLEAIVDTLQRFTPRVRTDPTATEVVQHGLQLLESLLVTRIHTTDYGALTQLLLLLQPVHELLLRITAPTFPAALRLRGTTVLRALLLENEAPTATKLQDIARSTGALLWHVAYAIADPVAEQKIAAAAAAAAVSAAAAAVPAPAASPAATDHPAPAAEGEHSAAAAAATGGSGGSDSGSTASATASAPTGALPHTASSAALAEVAQQRNASRDLVGLLCDDNPSSRAAVLRMLPPPMGSRLATPQAVHPPPAQARFSASKYRKASEKQVKNLKINRGNWNALWDAVERDHENELMIWNAATRAELRAAVQQEIQAVLTSGQWDWQALDVEYGSIAHELRAGAYYLRLLLPKITADSHYEFSDPRAFIRELYDAAVVEDDPQRKAVVLETLSAVLSRHAAGVSDLMPLRYFAWLLSPAHADTKFLPALFGLLRRLFADQPALLKPFVEAGGVSGLVYHAEAALADEDRSALAVEALSLLRQCSSLQRARRQLTSPSLLPHVIRLLLMPQVGSQTAFILASVLPPENPAASAAFEHGLFDAVLYALTRGPTTAAENAAILLANLHHRQRGHTAGSYLSTYLPAPLLALLDASPKTFSSTFYADVATAQVIWTREMRDGLADALATHLAPVLEALKRDPHGAVQWPGRLTVEYPALRSVVLVGKVYVDSYVSDTAYQVADPVGFLIELCSYLRSSPPPTSAIIVKILHAIDALIQRQPRSVTALSGPQLAQDVLPPLLGTLNATEHQQPEQPSAALAVLARMLALAATAVVGPLVAAGGVAAAARLAARAADNDALLEQVCRVLSTAALASHSAGPTTGRAIADAIAAETTLPATLAARLMPSVVQRGRAPAAGAPSTDLVGAATALLPILCQASAPMAAALAERGAAMWMLHRVLSKGAAPEQALAAATALHTMMKTDPAVLAHVEALLPAGHAPHLLSDDPSALVSHLREDTEVPLLIWNQPLRDELLAHLAAAEPRVQSGTPFAWKEERMTYAGLRDEVCVHGVYLRVLVAQPQATVPQPSLLATDLATGLAGGKLAADTAVLYAQALRVLLASRSDVAAEIVAMTETVTAICNQVSGPEPPRQAILGVLATLAESTKGAALIFQHSAPALQRLLHEPTAPSLYAAAAVLANLAKRHPEAALWMTDSGTLLKLLDFMTNTAGSPNARVAAARVVVALTAESGATKPLLNLMTHVLTPQFETALKTPSGDELIAAYDRDHASPLMVWDQDMRDDVRAMIARELKPVEKALLAGEVPKWDWLHLGERFERPHFRAQLCVGGVFVAQFVAQPFFAVPRAPFLHALYDAIDADQTYVFQHDGSREAESHWRTLALEWEAVHALLTNHPTMVDGAELQRETIVPLTARALQVTEKPAVLSPVLSVLESMSKNDQCVAAMVSAGLARSLLRVLHTQIKLRLLTLSVLLALSRRSVAFADQVDAAGATIVLLHVLLSSHETEHRRRAAELLSTLAGRLPGGQRVRDTVAAVTTEQIAEDLKLRAESFVEFVDGDHESRGRKWGNDLRERLRTFLATEAAELAARPDDRWDGSTPRWDAGRLVQVYPELGKTDAPAAAAAAATATTAAAAAAAPSS